MMGLLWMFLTGLISLSAFAGRISLVEKSPEYKGILETLIQETISHTPGAFVSTFKREVQVEAKELSPRALDAEKYFCGNDSKIVYARVIQRFKKAKIQIDKNLLFFLKAVLKIRDWIKLAANMRVFKPMR
jgi:hypothetical protein